MCFTLNNYTADECERIEKLYEEGKVSYIVVGKEVGDNGTPHLQGYLELARKRRMGGLKRLGGLARAHFEFARGSPVEAAEYCKKDTTWIEKGTRMETGSRSDLRNAVTLIEEGKSMRQVAELYPVAYVQSFRGLERLRAILKDERRQWKTNVQVFWGRETGTGKSRLAAGLAGENPFYFMPSASGCWFDGYEGQTVAIFDDFDGWQVPFRMLLQILDRYPYRVPIKGGSREWCPKKIYITSNYAPHEWYRHVNQLDICPLQRRLDGVFRVEESIW